MQLLFALTLLTSATLLFVVEPMFAKMVLPLLGGTPSVWNTCLVFYQAALLAGYVYAHLSIRWLGARRQAVLHLGLLCLPWLVLPLGIAAGRSPPTQDNPVGWLLMLLAVSVGLPFLVVSAGAPMLQAWFADTGHPAAKDPYFLYAASNLGSMVALLGYPVLLEPNLTLADQSWAWAAGYGLLMALTLGCAVVLWRSPRGLAGAQRHESPLSLWERGVVVTSLPQGERGVVVEASPTFGRRLWWLALSFAPSSLLLGVTAHISTDIAAVPLMWVVPLALYLLTFVLVFARRTILPHAWMVRLQPLLVVPVAVLFFLAVSHWVWILIPAHLAVFFVTAMVCHGELAASRPSARHLTEFYLWMSFGGVLGGLLNAIVAPNLFSTVIEYPLVIAVACALRPRRLSLWERPQQGPLSLWERVRVRAAPSPERPAGGWWQSAAMPQLVENPGASLRSAPATLRQRCLDVALPVGLVLVWAGLGIGLRGTGLTGGMAGTTVFLATAALTAFSFQDRPLRFALGVAALMIVGLLYADRPGRPLWTERNFFGVLHVKENPRLDACVLVQGSTNHGMQSRDPARRHEPLTYYHRTGPLGQLFALLDGSRPPRRIGIIGLGAGSMACYGRAGQQITYFEIDPAVERIARDPRYFTFLRDCPAEVEVVLGDARLTLADVPDETFDLVILDAFSSDSIPVHLITREAVQLYLRKLTGDGLLAMHLSNSYLDLRPVVGNLAADAGVLGCIEDDGEVSEAKLHQGKFPSRWVVLARDIKVLDALLADSRWHVLLGQPASRIWTDNFSNILSVLRW